MGDRTIRWGILGASRIAADFVAALKRVDNARVIAVAARSRSSAQRFADAHRLLFAVSPYSDICGREDVDVVYVATPNSTHPELVSAALDAGKHVLCEKPLAPDGHIAAALFDQAEASGLILAEGFMYRYHAQTRMLIDAIAAGRIGAVLVLRACYSFPLEGGNDIRLSPELQGGSLWDIGSYPVNLARAIFGEPLAATGRRLGDSHAVDRGFVGTLEFGGGRVCSFDCSFDLPLRRWIEVVGTDGTLHAGNAFMPYRGQLLLRLVAETKALLTEESNPYTEEARAMTRSVLTGINETLGREDAVGNARTLAALYQSAAEGVTISLDSSSSVRDGSL